MNAGVSVNTRVQRIYFREVENDGRRIYHPIDGHRPLTPAHTADGSVGLTPLHLASLVGNLSMTQYFLLHGADPTIVSEHGATPLHLAFCPRHYNGDYEDAWKNSRYRLESVLHVNDFEDKNDYSEAHMKIHKQRCAVLHEMLMYSKANANAQDTDGTSCLHIVDYRSTIPLFLLRIGHPYICSPLYVQGVTYIYGCKHQYDCHHCNYSPIFWPRWCNGMVQP